MYRYLLFDLDGTLTDSAEGIIKCVQYAAKKMGAEYKSAEELRVFVGPPLSESFKVVYGFSEEETRQAIVYYRERFQPIGMYENAVYPGIPELLECMKVHGKINLIASSKPEAFVKTILEHFDIAKYFDVIVGASMDESRNTKEAVIEEALSQLKNTDRYGQYSPDKCVMIGDRKYDICGAKYFGLRNIGVSYGFAPEGELKEAGADVIVDTVEELTQMLLSE
jgi:phosphoglycolate phosphatase